MASTMVENVCGFGPASSAGSATLSGEKEQNNKVNKRTNTNRVPVRCVNPDTPDEMKHPKVVFARLYVGEFAPLFDQLMRNQVLRKRLIERDFINPATAIESLLRMRAEYYQGVYGPCTSTDNQFYDPVQYDVLACASCSAHHDCACFLTAKKRKFGSEVSDNAEVVIRSTLKRKRVQRKTVSNRITRKRNTEFERLHKIRRHWHRLYSYNQVAVVVHRAEKRYGVDEVARRIERLDSQRFPDGALFEELMRNRILPVEEIVVEKPQRGFWEDGASPYSLNAFLRENHDRTFGDKDEDDSDSFDPIEPFMDRPQQQQQPRQATAWTNQSITLQYLQDLGRSEFLTKEEIPSVCPDCASHRLMSTPGPKIPQEGKKKKANGNALFCLTCGYIIGYAKAVVMNAGLRDYHHVTPYMEAAVDILPDFGITRRLKKTVTGVAEPFTNMLSRISEEVHDETGILAQIKNLIAELSGIVSDVTSSAFAGVVRTIDGWIRKFGEAIGAKEEEIDNFIDIVAKHPIGLIAALRQLTRISDKEDLILVMTVFASLLGLEAQIIEYLLTKLPSMLSKLSSIPYEDIKSLYCEITAASLEVDGEEVEAFGLTEFVTGAAEGLTKAFAFITAPIKIIQGLYTKKNLDMFNALGRIPESCQKLYQTIWNLLIKIGLVEDEDKKLIEDLLKRTEKVSADYVIIRKHVDLGSNDIFSGKFSSKVTHVRAEIGTLYKTVCTSKVPAPHELTRKIGVLYGQVELLFADYLKITAGNNSRQKPAGFYFVSRLSQIGKSMLCNSIPEMLLEYVKKNSGETLHEVWSQFEDPATWYWNTTDDYHEGYFGQVVTVADDFNSRQDNKDHPDILTMISTTPYLTRQAALEAKGKPYLSLLFLANANSWITQSRTINNIHALQQRFTVVEVGVKTDDAGARVPIPTVLDKKFSHLSFKISPGRGFRYGQGQQATLNDIFAQMKRELESNFDLHKSTLGAQVTPFMRRAFTGAFGRHSDGVTEDIDYTLDERRVVSFTDDERIEPVTQKDLGIYRQRLRQVMEQEESSGVHRVRKNQKKSIVELRKYYTKLGGVEMERPKIRGKPAWFPLRYIADYYKATKFFCKSNFESDIKEGTIKRYELYCQLDEHLNLVQKPEYTRYDVYEPTEQHPSLWINTWWTKTVQLDYEIMAKTIREHPEGIDDVEALIVQMKELPLQLIEEWFVVRFGNCFGPEIALISEYGAFVYIGPNCILAHYSDRHIKYPWIKYFTQWLTNSFFGAFATGYAVYMIVTGLGIGLSSLYRKMHKPCEASKPYRAKVSKDFYDPNVIGVVETTRDLPSLDFTCKCSYCNYGVRTEKLVEILATAGWNLPIREMKFVTWRLKRMMWKGVFITDDILEIWKAYFARGASLSDNLVRESLFSGVVSKNNIKLDRSTVFSGQFKSGKVNKVPVHFANVKGVISPTEAVTKTATAFGAGFWTTPYDYYGLNKEKTKEEDQHDEVKPFSGHDVSCEQMMAKLHRKNLVEVTTQNGNYLYGMAHERVVIIPKHVLLGVKSISQVNVRSTDGLNYTPVDAIVHPTKQWDLCLLVMGKTFPAHQNLSKYLNDGEVFEKHTGGNHLWVSPTSGVQTYVGLRYQKSLKVGPNHQQEVILRSVVGSALSLRRGECGAPIAIAAPSEPGKIIGILTGVSASGHSIFQAIPKIVLNTIIAEGVSSPLGYGDSYMDLFENAGFEGVQEYGDKMTVPCDVCHEGIPISSYEEHAARCVALDSTKEIRPAGDLPVFDDNDYLVDELPERNRAPKGAIIHGKTKTQCQPTTGDSSLRRHLLFGAFPVTQVPSALTLRKVVDKSQLVEDQSGALSLVATQTSKWTTGTVEIPEADQKTMEKMVDEMELTWWGRMQNEWLGTLEDDEVLNGREFRTLSNDIVSHSTADTGLALDTSPGFPWNSHFKTKKAMTKMTNGKHVWDRENPKVDAVLSEIERKEQRARKGQRVLGLWVDKLKDETRPLEKVQVGKTRVFTIPDVTFTYLATKYFQSFKSAFTRNRHYFHHGLGINPHSPEWTMLANRLQSKGNKMIDLDYTNWDGSMHPFFFGLATKLRCRLMYRWDEIHDPEHAEENLKVRQVLSDEVMFPYHLTVDTVWSTRQGNCSGQTLTTIDNCIVNTLYMMYVYYKMTKNDTYSDFCRDIELVDFGDDLVVSPALHLQNIFTLPNVITMLKNIGVTATSGDKKSTYEARPLSNMIFLKRRFKQTSFGYVAPLEFDSIIQQFNWSFIKPDDYQVIQQQLSEACLEAVLHGSVKYEQFRMALLERIAQTGISELAQSILSYRAASQLFAERFGLISIVDNATPEESSLKESEL